MLFHSFSSPLIMGNHGCQICSPVTSWNIDWGTRIKNPGEQKTIRFSTRNQLPTFKTQQGATYSTRAIPTYRRSGQRGREEARRGSGEGLRKYLRTLDTSN